MTLIGECYAFNTSNYLMLWTPKMLLLLLLRCCCRSVGWFRLLYCHRAIFSFFVVYSSWYLNAYRLNLHLAWSGETSDDYWLCVYFAMQILFGAILCQHGHNSLKQWNSNIAAVHKNLLKMIIIPPKIHRTKKITAVAWVQI